MKTTNLVLRSFSVGGKTMLYAFMAAALMFNLSCSPGEDGTNGTDGIDGIDGQDGVDGEDGNANVTVHIFPGHDFTTNPTASLCFGNSISEDDFSNSSFETYLGYISSTVTLYEYAPGLTNLGDEYSVYKGFDSVSCTDAAYLVTILESGPGHSYDEIRIIQTVANNVEDHTRVANPNKENYKTYLATFDKDEIEYVYH